MRFIKLAIFSFIVFFGILTLMSLLIPSHIRISKAINLSPQADSVFYLIKDKNKWPMWHPAYQQTGTGDDRMGKQQVSTVLQNDSLLVMDVTNAEGRTVRNSWQLHRFGAADAVTLQWYMDFQLPWYPWEKFRSLFYEGTYGRIMQQGLDNLKNLAESSDN